MALSKKQANQISSLINSLMVHQQFIDEHGNNVDLFLQHARWYNEAVEALAAMNINVTKYNLTSLEA